VDDNPDLLELVTIKLKAEGYSCTGAECAESALALAREQHFDLIISDILMPCIDGFTFIEVLKAKYPTVGIIAITGITEVESAVKAMKAGADDYSPSPSTSTIWLSAWNAPSKNRGWSLKTAITSNSSNKEFGRPRRNSAKP
jgi:DNA-binding response OmpR family regulator